MGDENETHGVEAGRPSVRIARSAKGETTYEVKVYDDDPDAATATATRLYEELTARYHPDLATGGAR